MKSPEVKYSIITENKFEGMKYVGKSSLKDRGDNGRNEYSN